MSELKCINCDNDINDDDEEEHFVEATIDSSSKFCHLKCFRCNICNELLTGWYFEKGGLVYCRKDYYHKYGERCRHCCNVMSGPVMVVGGGEIKFHPECFKCSNCAAIIGDDESYACLQECQLYCKLCFTNTLQNNDIHSLRHCLNFQEISCDQFFNNNDNIDEHEKTIHIKGLSISNNNKKNNSSSISSSSSSSSKKNNNDRYGYHESKFIGSGQQYSINILPSLTSTVNEKKTSKRIIKLIVRDCQISNRFGQVHHNGTCDVVSTNHNGCNVSTNNTTTESSLHSRQSDCENRKASTTNGMFQISDIDIKYDLDLFHIGGDRLLAFNHKNVQNKTLNDLECLIDNAKDDIIELTLEHRSHHIKTNGQTSELLQSSFDANSSFDSESHSDLSRPDSEERAVEVRVLGKPPIRPNSVLSTTNLNCVEKNPNDGLININCVLPTKNSQDSVKIKSRVHEKRNRNRERSSSLSRLLESIRLSSDVNINTKSNTNECCNHYSTEDDNSQENEPVRAIPKVLSSLSHTTRLGGRLSNSLSRTKSFRVEPKSYRIFRAADLVKGALLGKGSFGEVYEVTDKVTKEKMVLKELYHNDREAEANFVREVQILKSLNHKNVLQFIGILYRGRKLNLITEYITGGTLKKLIQQRQNILTIWPERIGWARDIASGMNYLHSMSLIHRDLNSQNCLVREDGTVVVADFGLSKIICTDDNDENNVDLDLNPQMQKLIKKRDRRKRYTIVGNPFWMAPEMMHRNKYDERVDIYSFGIILLEIIGSMDADPDDLRRNGDFSVDKNYFLENFVQKSCPSIFWQIAFLCTEMNPDHRPPFHVQERWFQVIYNSMAYSHQKLSFRNLAESGTLFQLDSIMMRDNLNDTGTNYDNLMPYEIQIEVNTFNIPQSLSP